MTAGTAVHLRIEDVASGVSSVAMVPLGKDGLVAFPVTFPPGNYGLRSSLWEGGSPRRSRLNAKQTHRLFDASRLRAFVCASREVALFVAQTTESSWHLPGSCPLAGASLLMWLLA